ncbi:MAG: hypothetical protein WED33_03565 [Bacteroidia bacterium]
MGIGTVTPHPSAKLDVESSEQGFLSPRMTSEQREAIDNPATGLLVYDIGDSAFWFYSGIAWQSLETEPPIIPEIPVDYLFSNLSQSGLAGAGPTILGSNLIPSSATDLDGRWLDFHAFGTISSDSSSIIFRFEGNDLIFPLTNQGDWEAKIRVYRESSLSMKISGTLTVGTYCITRNSSVAHNFDGDMLFQILCSQDPVILNGVGLEGYSISRVN